ncbi:CorA family divalent cation transporter [Dysgonomonas sp.]
MSKRISKRKSKSAHRSYLSKPAYFGDKNIPLSVELIQFDETHFEKKTLPIDFSINDEIDKTKVNWFKIKGISDVVQINRICREVGLHGFDVKDLLADQQVVKAVTYDNISYVLTPVFYINEKEDIDDMQIAFILGKNFVISIQEEIMPVFSEIEKSIEDNNILIRQKSADFLLYIMMGAINTININTVMSLEDQLADTEEDLIQRKESVDILQFLHNSRVHYTRIKRAVISLREEYVNLLHNTNKLIKDENMVYFNDFDDRMRVTLGDLASFYESLSSLLDLYYNNNNLKLNEIIKRLTIVSTMFIPLTFMVGVWGMNFKFMPETDWPHGYIFAWGILALIAVFTFIWMKKQKWF